MLCRCNCTDDRRRGVGLISPTQSERPVAAGKTSSSNCANNGGRGQKRAREVLEPGAKRLQQGDEAWLPSRGKPPADPCPRPSKAYNETYLRPRFARPFLSHPQPSPPPPPQTLRIRARLRSRDLRTTLACLPRFCALWDLPATPRPLSSFRATPRLPFSTPLPQPLRLDFPRLRRASLRCFG